MDRMNKMITFKELRNIALKNGVVDDKVHIGIWAQQNGYIKKRIQRDYKIGYYYMQIMR